MILKGKIPENPHAKGLLKAKETLDILKMDAKERAEYEQYLKGLHDMATSFHHTFFFKKQIIYKCLFYGILIENQNYNN